MAVRNCAKLEREVLMYQWQENSQEEERDTAFGGKEKVTIYTYNTDWIGYPVDSSTFQEPGHDNPPMPVESKTHQAHVRLGAFHLPKRLVSDKMCNFQPLADEEMSMQVPPIRGVVKSLVLKGNTYSNEDLVSGPQVGDLRVTFRKVPCGDCTVLAVQNGNKLAPLTFDMEIENGKVVVKSAGAGNDPLLAAQKLEEASGDLSLDLDNVGCCGLIGKLVEAREEVFELTERKATLSDMMRGAEESQHIIHLILQIVGFVLFFVGFDMIFNFIPALFRIIPFIGTWIQLFGNFLAAIAAFLFAGTFWCFTVAVAWLAARPLKGLVLLTVAVLCIVLPTMLAANMGPQPIS